jgi:hypothetical protein
LFLLVVCSDFIWGVVKINGVGSTAFGGWGIDDPSTGHLKADQGGVWKTNEMEAREV